MQEDIVVVWDDSAVGFDTAKELAEVKMMLRKQDAEMEKLRSQLAGTEIEKRKEEMIPDLSLEEIERFLKKERVTVWMKDMSEVLKNYVAAVPNPCRPTDVTAKICSHRRVRVEISTRTRWFFLCWKFVIFHAKFMCGVSPYPTQPLFALPLHHWVPLQTLPTVGRLLPLQSVPKTILNFPKPCFQIVL